MSSIEQSSVISVSALKKLVSAADGSPVTINVNMSSLQVSGESSNMEGLPVDDPGLLMYIEKLPPPRMRSLIERVYQLSMIRNRNNKSKAAEWLGVSKRSFYPERRICFAETVNK